MSYRGKGGPQNEDHEVVIEFYGEIDVEKSKYVVNARNIPMVLFRKEEGTYWPRLLKEKTKVSMSCCIILPHSILTLCKYAFCTIIVNLIGCSTQVCLYAVGQVTD